MGRKNKQLNIKNVKNIIEQESFRKGTPHTKCKLLYRMGNFLVQTNNLKYMNQGLDAYNKIYDILSTTYGNMHPRTTNVILKIVSTEKKIDNRKFHLKKEKKNK
tara:strand:+ start:292 stop:603 length:312 start_codon:yes stop_codon:yes gene_type:complete